MVYIVKDKLPENISNGLISSNSWANRNLISVYELHDGRLRPIQDQDGLLMDNYLNAAYKKISAEYLKMLYYYEDESFNS